MKISEYIKKSTFKQDEKLPDDAVATILPNVQEIVNKQMEDGSIVQVLEDEREPNKQLKVDFRTYSPAFLEKMGNPQVNSVGVNALETMDKINSIQKPQTEQS